MVTLIEGRELKNKEVCVKGWAGWTQVSEAEKVQSSKNLCTK